MKKLIVTASLIVGMLVSSLTSPLLVSASAPLTQPAICASSPWSNFFGFQPWYACLQKDSDGKPKITKLTDLFLIAFPVVESIIKLAMYVAIGMIFFMLFKMATANGNSSSFASALGGMRDAVVGLVIAMISVAIVGFIAGAFTTVKVGP